MVNYIPASPEFKNAIEEICPNEFGLPVMDWLKIAAKRIGIDYVRLCRLWRDNRAKLHRYEQNWIEESLSSVRLLKEIERNKLMSKYLQNKITGELNEQSTFETGPHTHTACHGF